MEGSARYCVVVEGVVDTVNCGWECRYCFGMEGSGVHTLTVDEGEVDPVRRGREWWTCLSVVERNGGWL